MDYDTPHIDKNNALYMPGGDFGVRDREIHFSYIRVDDSQYLITEYDIYPGELAGEPDGYETEQYQLLYQDGKWKFDKVFNRDMGYFSDFEVYRNKIEENAGLADDSVDSFIDTLNKMPFSSFSGVSTVSRSLYFG